LFSTSAVLLALFVARNELLSGWNGVFQYILMLILVTCLVAGLMANTPITPTQCTRVVSYLCARICTCLATLMLIVALSSHFGWGCIAGIITGVVVDAFIVTLLF